MDQDEQFESGNLGERVPRDFGHLTRFWLRLEQIVGLHADITALLKSSKALPFGFPDADRFGVEAVSNYLWAYPPVVVPVRTSGGDETDNYKCISGIASFWLMHSCFGPTDEVHVLISPARFDLARMRKAALAELALMQFTQLNAAGNAAIAQSNLGRLAKAKREECAALGINPSELASSMPVDSQ